MQDGRLCVQYDRYIQYSIQIVYHHHIIMCTLSPATRSAYYTVYTVYRVVRFTYTHYLLYGAAATAQPRHKNRRATCVAATKQERGATSRSGPRSSCVARAFLLAASKRLLHIEHYLFLLKGSSQSTFPE